MPEPLQHGIQITEVSAGALPIRPVSTAVIGLIATATAAVGAPTTALDEAFPLDTPVLVTNIRSAIGLAGTGGTLKPALRAIADQTSPLVIVVRVAEATAGENNPTQDELVAGDVIDGVYTGAMALLAAENQTGIRPRIFGAPGLDSQAVVNALIPIAQKLRGVVYAQCEGDTVAEAQDYAGDFGQRELMLLWPRFLNEFSGDTVARALGLRAKIDHDIGWHKTLSNVVVNGVTGLDRDVYFDLMSENTDAGVLNGAKITTIIRREGFRFWGNRTLSADPKFSFESAVRTNFVLQDEIVQGLFPFVDKPLTKVLAKDSIETINGRFRRLMPDRLIGAKAWFDPDMNQPITLSNGELRIPYKFTPCAPAELFALQSEITDEFYVSFADLVA